jgi:uncharacterized membrane protein YqgA involved in biofilm formation
MHIHGLGTIINVLSILLGSILGVTFGSRLSENAREVTTLSLSFITSLAAVDALRSVWDPSLAAALPKGAPLFLLLVALLAGVAIGLVIKIEYHLERFGEKLKARFTKDHDSPFIEGFVSSSLLFVIGPMAILGSISDGMGSGITQLTLKSILDGITSIAFAASLGWGVAFSALPVGIYQGLWTVVGFFLGLVLPHYAIVAMTALGGILLMGIALRIMKVKMVPVATMLPGLFLAPIFAILLHALK